MDIAARGYVYEQYYAFFPLLPWLLSLAPARSRASLALAVSAAASVLGTVLLYRLGERVTRCRRLAALACIFFIFNPASIFHAAPYTESAFAAATLAALHCLYCRGSLLLATAAVAVSCGLRSNGIVNAGYLGHFCLTRAVAAWSSRKARAVFWLVTGVLAAAASVSPLVVFQWAAYTSFCRTTGREGGAGPAAAAPWDPVAAAPGKEGGDYSWPRPWCSSRLPYVYGFVQAEYWNVGFLRYYTVQQLPNFLLAAPVLVLSLAGLAEYCAANAKHVLALGLTPLPRPPGPTHAPVNMDVQSTAASSGWAAAPSQEGSTRPPGTGVGGIRQRLMGRQRRADTGNGMGELTRKSHVASGGGGAAASWSACSGGAGAGSEKAQDVTAEAGSWVNLRDDAGSSGSGGEAAARGGYLRPELTVFMYPWAFSLAVALTAMHVQVATRFLLSACPPLYWFMAHVWLRSCYGAKGRGAASATGGAQQRGDSSGGKGSGGRGGDARESGGAVGTGGGSACGEQAVGGGGGWRWPGWCAVALWRWCLGYMVLGCVLFINFMPWT